MASKTKSPLEQILQEDQQKQILLSLQELKEELADLKKKFDFLYNAMNSNARRILMLEEK
ncbi:MAG: hypothetical protein DRP02_08815 [Candidatus Gerdarchaeota archaeon]|nr:MAG: hypothetical protein DRP02_08815 [Candidatus Gerdarchaeota archaeon]